MTKVLFVCLGNICRSPLAEAIFDHKCKEKGLKNFSSDSAGTAAYHVGEQPDYRTIQVANEQGVYINHRARQFRQVDCDEFDHIFAMDTSNHQNIVNIAGFKPEQLKLLRKYNSGSFKDGNLNVPDPYYGGIDGFSLIFDILSNAIDNFLDQIANHD